MYKWKNYELCYIVQDSSMNKNWIHTLVIDSNGTVLKSCEYELNDNAYVRPLPTDIDWISEHYRDATVLGYINDLGYDNYLIMHNGVLKSVLFDSHNIDSNGRRQDMPCQKALLYRVVCLTHYIQNIQISLIQKSLS